jgi:DNA helicase-2/ATP-dependent DNA helicase PcrA
VTYLEGLNPEQKEAVEHVTGPILVLAGAGSGKTRVLTTRIAHLVNEHGVDPRSILSVTFTNKAAAEMRTRVRRLLGREPAGMWMGTFHSIGVRLLRRHAVLLGWTPNFTIYDADEAEREVKRALERLNLSPKKWSPKAVHSAISSAKNQLVDPDAYAKTAADPFARIVASVYPEYQKALRTQNAFDFDDLLVKPVELLRDNENVLFAYRARFNFVLVDEYQDTNHAQYVLLQLVAGGPDGGNLMVVGDDDQSIYGWRGADIRNILDFEKDFPDARIVRLEQNYRSTSRILDAANAIIAQNRQRKGKTLRTDAGPGERITIVSALDERDEADWIGGEIESRMRGGASARDYVVLYRTNSMSRAFEESFNRRGLPYVIVGGIRFYERREIMNALAYLRLISNPRDAGAFDRIINYPRRGIGDKSLAQLLEWATTQGLSPLEAAVRADEVPELRGAAASSFVAFAGMIQRYTALAAHLNVGELVAKLIAEIGLIDALREEGPEGADRIENVNELIAGAADFAAHEVEDVDMEEEDRRIESTQLDRYLQKITLQTDVDRHDPEAQAVTLMTAHNAKGLEYPVVFIAGMEDGLFPLMRAFDEPAALEEERRLFYVAITRAERKLFISHARTRRRAGEVMPARQSSFLDPMPKDLMDEMITPGLERARFSGEVRWSRRDAAMPGVGSLGYRDRAPAKPRNPRFDDDNEGVYIDYSDAQDTPRFVKGERVRHPSFGRGIIRELTGFGQDLKAVIDFDAVGRKKVLLRFANLQKEL